MVLNKLTNVVGTLVTLKYDEALGPPWTGLDGFIAIKCNEAVCSLVVHSLQAKNN